jgi:NCS1 family nucleobase:cation symporter-1
LERLGIEYVREELRHGAPFITFTLWLGANLTIADYALGYLFFGLPVSSILIAVVVGNLLGGLLLGLMSAMGPTFGFPQMMISRAVMGKKGNFPFALANWISTVGWFTVNIILGGFAIQLAFGLPFYLAAAILVVVDVILALYGHDIIHLFEKVMSVVLAIMFAVILVISYGKFAAQLPAYQQLPSVSFNPYFFALVIALAFSYLMSWSPYASDYTRYLPQKASKGRIIAYTMTGGVIASAWTEIIGFVVYVGANNSKLSPIQALASVSGGYSIFALLTVVLGAVAADALNIYSNSLSALVVYGKAKRVQTVLLAGVVGFLLALAGSSNFGSFYQNFLLTLDYWITPWIGVMLAAFFIIGVRSGVENAGSILPRGLASYVIGLLLSVPFMNLTSYGINYIGPVASAWQGADISYFVACGVAFAVYVFLSRTRLWSPKQSPIQSTAAASKTVRSRQ